ncbi:MAG: diaminopimelate epimerase [Acidobacteria bacterium]|nr:diaminopimelate epimerase [Acidobacteriota bacterium]
MTDPQRMTVMEIPFLKAQAVGNDFLVAEWESLTHAGLQEQDLPELAKRSCHRQFGVGADGVEVVFPARSGEEDYSLRIFNSDGSEAEISGNGTRCAAAFLMRDSQPGAALRIGTKAGVKTVRLLNRDGVRFDFEMGMGVPSWNPAEIGCELEAGGWPREVAIVDVGNPQCALFVEHFDWDWRTLGAEIERHPRFPKRTNVSFVRRVDEKTIDVRFWERGAGETLSSGTGSTGAAVASVLSGRAKSPVVIQTPAGEMTVRWQTPQSEVSLEGPAELIAWGALYFPR